MSVLLRVDTQRDRVERCLHSVLTQDGAEDLEVILVDFAPDLPPLRGSDAPNVRVLHWPRGMKIGIVLARMVHEARAPFVAFLEDHTWAEPGWARATMAGLEDYAGVGGSIQYSNRGYGIADYVGDSSYFGWLPPITRHESTYLPGHNAAYRKSALVRYGRQLALLLRTDVMLQWKLIDDGETLLMDPAVAIQHINDTHLFHFLTGTFHWNRLTGSIRPTIEGWSQVKSMAYFLTIPARVVLRQARIMVGWQKAGQTSTAVGTGVAFLACLSAFTGQAIGMIAGSGKSEHAFLDYELNSYRHDPSLQGWTPD